MNPGQEPIVLLQMRNLTMKLGRVAPPSGIALLKETVWGTPGALRYQHHNTEEKIHRQLDPWFLYLEKDGETIGILCLDHRSIAGLDAFYIRYFSFSEGLRRKDAKIDEPEAHASKGQGAFKRFAQSFFSKPTPLLEAVGIEKAVFYAFVELENARSRDMVAQMGLSQHGQFSTLVFSRIFHRKHPQVRRARPEEYPQLRAMVATAYEDHAFYSDHGLFYKDNFFVVEVGGKIVAGLQAHPVQWRIIDIPGRSGKILIRVLPYLPIVRRLMHPDAFRFAAVEGLFCLPGHESQLQPLLEGTLSHLGLHNLLIWLSTDSSLIPKIREHVRLGLLEKFKKDAPATVVARNFGYSDAEIAALTNHPVFVSAFDST